jgi:hypothetical protein
MKKKPEVENLVALSLFPDFYPKYSGVCIVSENMIFILPPLFELYIFPHIPTLCGK